MNELQKVELEIFNCFAEVCDKLNLNYFLVCGSALGAARHGGFIPWDDDFDVGMCREDYDKFMELAPELLPDGIFLQNYKSDPNYPLVYAKLRNSNTTAIESYYKNIDMNQGLYIDIFPLDGYPNDEKEQLRLESLIRKYKTLSRCGLNYTEKLSLKSRIALKIRRILGYHKRTAKILEKYESLISAFPIEKSKFVCSFGTPYGRSDYIVKEYYGKGTIMLFEGIEVRVPEKCDEYLTAIYGDWRTPPPPEQRVGKHMFEICDTERSYKEYLNFKKNH